MHDCIQCFKNFYEKYQKINLTILFHRFSTLVKPRSNQRKSVKTILDDFHAKQQRDNTKFHNKPKAHTKAIRNLEISGPILPDNTKDEVIDLCKFSSKTDSGFPEDIISTYSSSSVSEQSNEGTTHTDDQPIYEMDDIKIVVVARRDTFSSKRSSSSANHSSFRTSSISNKGVTISDQPAEMIEIPPARPQRLPRSQSAVETTKASTTERMDHVMELKKRFSDIKLKPVQQQKTSKPSAAQDHMTELKQRLDQLASKVDATKSAVTGGMIEGDYLNPQPNVSGKIHFHMSNGGEFYQYTQ